MTALQSNANGALAASGMPGGSIVTKLKSNKPVAAVRWVVVAGIAITVWYITIPRPILGNCTRFETDSTGYIECAESIRRGKGCYVRPSGGLKPEIWEPMRFWPPGYPILIAAGQIFGFSAMDSSIIVSCLSVAFFIALVARIAMQMLPIGIALLATLTIAIMPAVVYICPMSGSDGPHLLFATASIACLLAGNRSDSRAWLWFLIGGTLAGIAWGVRYPGISIIATEGMVNLGYVIVPGPRRKLVNPLFVWVVGVIIGAGPFAIHNYLVFGHTLSYPALPSEDSLLHNTVSAAKTMIREFGGIVWGRTSGVRWGLAYAFGAFAFLWLAVSSILLMIVLAPRTLNAHIRDLLQQHYPAVLLFSYSLIYTVLIIVAKTRYRMQPIDSRYIIPASWSLWILLAYVTIELSSGRSAGIRKAGITAIVLLLATALALEAMAAVWDVPGRGAESIEAVSNQRLIGNVNLNVRRDQIILSCQACRLRLFDINGRQLHCSLPIGAIIDAGNRGFLWGVAIDDVKGARDGRYGELAQGLALGTSDYRELFQAFYRDDTAILFRYVNVESKLR